ncbi:hypothetical protein II898_01300 [bacterium]|nr:hypothetical protein [bacterium]MBR0192557.1 hypothetical protein [Thermoguttaceae bacterium]
MEGTEERKEARFISKAQGYIKKIYESMGSSDQPTDQNYFDGCFRGFVHALGEAGLITREYEFNLCKIDFKELKKRQALVMCKLYLSDGFAAVRNGIKSDFDKIYKECITDEFEK